MLSGHLIAGLDIGTNSIKILLALKKPGESDLAVVSQAEVQNLGMRKGVVINSDEVSSRLRQVIDFCQKDLAKKHFLVNVNINGSHLGFLSSRGLVSVSRADQRISETDIERALQASKAISLSANQEIIDVFPQEFIIDGQPGIKQAEGLRGIRLEAKTLCLTVFAPYFKNLTDAVCNADLEINQIIPSILASCRAVLDPKEKELGVAVVEIGAGTTGLAVYEEGSLIQATVFPIGANNITNDIAIVLKTDIEMAEQIKKDFAGFNLRKKGSIKDKKFRTGHGFSQKVLNKVVEARTKEIFEEIMKELKRINKTKLPSGIVFTGGGAKMNKIIDFAKKELKLPCRLGSVKGFAPQIEDPSMAVVAGLILEGASAFEGEDKERFSLPAKSVIKRIKNIFRIFIP